MVLIDSYLLTVNAIRIKLNLGGGRQPRAYLALNRAETATERRCDRCAYEMTISSIRGRLVTVLEKLSLLLQIERHIDDHVFLATHHFAAPDFDQYGARVEAEILGRF